MNTSCAQQQHRCPVQQREGLNVKCPEPDEGATSCSSTSL